MIFFLPIIFKLFFRANEFAYLLRMFLSFHSHFLKSANQEQWHFVFDQCSEQMRRLSQFISVVFS